MNGGENNEFVCRVFKRRGKRARNKLFLPISYARGSSYDCLILLGMIYCRDSTFKHPYIKVTRSVDALYKRSSFLLFFFFFRLLKKSTKTHTKSITKATSLFWSFKKHFESFVKKEAMAIIYRTNAKPKRKRNARLIERRFKNSYRVAS